MIDLARRLVYFYQVQFDLLFRWRPGRRAWIRRTVVSFVVAFIALAVMAYVLPGISIRDPIAIGLAVIVLAAFNLLVRPVIIGLIAPVSPILVAVTALVLQVTAIFLLGPLVPGVTVDSVASAFWGSWIYAIVNYLLSTILSVSEDDSHYGALVRRLAARQQDAIQTDKPGLVVIQIDGLGYDVLKQQLHAGRAPVISSWVRRGSHRLTAWDALMPTQTSASQAGILHGNNDGIPAFRWLEKETGRLLVSNHPRDAAEIARRVSNGHGLLSAGGVSINNLLAGDASRSYLTMATLTASGNSLGQSRAFEWFFISPYNYLNMIVRFVGEFLKEYFQAWRQSRNAIEPRMNRGWPYPIARAATNVVLRALGTALVVEEMYLGTPVIYIDFTDYDEIAHHSGPERAESLDALDGVGRTLGTLAKAAESAARPYEFVVLSDHGQSLGATFFQRYGKTLQQVVEELMGGQPSVEAATSRAEEWGPLNAFLSEMSRVGGVTGGLTRAATKRRTTDGMVALGPDGREAREGPQTGEGSAASGRRGPRSNRQPADLTVCASGNLGLIYFAAEPRRMSIEAIEERYPGLVEGLTRHPGIGLLLIRSERRGAVCISRDGLRYLDEDRVQGRDPLALYGPTAAEGMRRLDGMANVGDIVAVSMYDPDADEVAAFEELIGSHGGLGGSQSRPLLLYPAAWELDGVPLVGAPAVYRQLRRWMSTKLGIELGPPDERFDPAAVDALVPETAAAAAATTTAAATPTAATGAAATVTTTATTGAATATPAPTTTEAAATDAKPATATPVRAGMVRDGAAEATARPDPG